MPKRRTTQVPEDFAKIENKFKLVFLESRLAAMESTFQKPRPIVLE